MSEQDTQDAAQTQAEAAPVESRYTRGADIIPEERLKATHAMIIGVGAIGRQVALQLAAMGVGELTLVDFDTVDIVNLGPQGFLSNQIGMPKVQAVGDLCTAANPDLTLHTENARFRRSMDVPSTIFCCVDNIDVRRLIWEAVSDQVEFFTDGRMTAESLHVITAADEIGKTHYPETLFSAGEAYQGSCTSKSTIFCANIAAGFMLEQFARFARGMPCDREVRLNLLAMEIDVV